MFQPGPSASDRATAAACRRGSATIARPRVPSTIWFTSPKSGQRLGHPRAERAEHAHAPRGDADVLVVHRDQAAEVRRPRDAPALDRRRADGAREGARCRRRRTAARGRRGRPPPRASARCRPPCAPSARSTESASHRSSTGSLGTRPGVVRKPTTPQNAAGMRSEPPRSEPCGDRAHARWPAPPPAAGAAAAGERGVPRIPGGAEHGVERVAAGAELRRVGLADHDGARRLAAAATISASSSGTRCS